MKIIDYFRKPKILAIIGDANCMPKGTLVKTPTGLKKIEEIETVLSYNFKKAKIEQKKAKIHLVGKKKVVLIKTKEGILKCSSDHKWFVCRNGEIIVLPTKDLNTSDVLLKI